MTLDQTIPYEPKKEVAKIPREKAKKLYAHYRGSGKNTRKYPLVLDSMNLSNSGFLYGFNPFILALLQSQRQEGKKRQVQLTTPPLDSIGYSLPYLQDYAKLLLNDPDLLKRHTVDFGLVLRGIGKPNEIHADDLADQIRAMYGSVTFPVLISLRGTHIKYHPTQEYDGFSFKITRETKIISAPVLNEPGFFSLNDLDLNTGLPKKTHEERNKGDLELITRDTFNNPVISGLSRAYFNIYGDFDLGHQDLSRIDPTSRIYVVDK